MKKTFLFLILFLLLSQIQIAFATDTVVYGSPTGGDAAFSSLTTPATYSSNQISINATCTGWTLGTGWACGGDGTIVKNADGTGTASFDVSSIEVNETDVYFSWTWSGLSGGALTPSQCGVSGTAQSSASGTATAFYTCSSTANLIFTPSVTGVRVVISNISLQSMTYGTVTSYRDIILYNGQLLLPAGSVKFPSVSFVDDPNTGISRFNSDTVNIVLGGLSKWQFGSSYLDGYSDGQGLRVGASSDTILIRDAANNWQLGADAATATDQTLSAADSTGASQAGATLILQGGAAGAGGVAGKIKFDSLTYNTVQAVSCTDGVGKSALTITPTSSYVEITNLDADGCDITMGETGMVAGATVTLCIVSSAGTTVDFADTAGVTEIAGAFAGTVDDCITLRYGNTTTWREVSRSAN
jgi:hypothetical protein